MNPASLHRRQALSLPGDYRQLSAPRAIDAAANTDPRNQRPARAEVFDFQLKKTRFRRIFWCPASAVGTAPGWRGAPLTWRWRPRLEHQPSSFLQLYLITIDAVRSFRRIGSSRRRDLNDERAYLTRGPRCAGEHHSILSSSRCYIAAALVR